MKYWAYFVAKLTVVAAGVWLGWLALNATLGEPQTFLYYRVSRFSQDLGWTTALLGLWLLAVGALYLAIWDQRRRCRTCLRRLRMPVEHGGWGQATLFGPPRVESICPYGHGTLNVSEVHLNGQAPAEWHAHDDIWRELEHFGSGRG